MRTVGEILKQTRQAKFYSLEEIEKHTKIRIELLQALEENDWSRLPPATFIQGFIKIYSKFLNLDSNKMLAIFRRDYEASKHPPVILDSLKRPLSNKKLSLTPTRVLGLTIILIILGFFVYLWIEYRQFVGPPTLSVSSPQDQVSVEIPTVLVEGQTDPEVKVMVNNQEIGVDKNGLFKEEVKLSSSVNNIIITATSRFGQTSKVERTVFVKK